MTGAALPAQPRQGSAPTTAGGVRLGTWLRLGWFGLTTVLLRRRGYAATGLACSRVAENVTAGARSCASCRFTRVGAR